MFAVVTFFAIATIIQSCDPDKVLIDTSLKLPPVPLDTEGWEVVEYSSQEDNDGEGEGNGRVWNTFDGNPDTFWHSCWWACTPTVPHYFIVDMKASQEINGFFIIQRQSLSRNIEICKIEVSDDNSSWTSLGEFTLEKVKASQDIALPDAVTARYFRFNVVKVYDGTNNAALAEIQPYSTSF